MRKSLAGSFRRLGFAPRKGSAHDGKGDDAGARKSASAPRAQDERRDTLLSQAQQYAREVKELRQRIRQEHEIGDVTQSFKDEVPRDLAAFMKYAKDVVEDIGPVRTSIARRRKKVEREQAEWARLEKIAQQAGLAEGDIAICDRRQADLAAEEEALADLDGGLDEASTQLAQIHEELRQLDGASFDAIALLSSLGTQLNPPFRSVLLATRLARKGKQGENGSYSSTTWSANNSGAAPAGGDEEDAGPAPWLTRSRPQASDGGLAPEEVCAALAKTKVLLTFASLQGGLKVARSIRRALAHDDLNLGADEFYVDLEDLRQHRCSTVEDGVVSNPHRAEYLAFAMMMTHAFVYVMDAAWQVDGWRDGDDARELRQMLASCYAQGAGDATDTFYGVDFDFIVAYPEVKSTLTGRDVGKLLLKINEVTQTQMRAVLVSLGVPEGKDLFFVDWASHSRIEALVAAAIKRVSSVLRAKNFRRPKQQELTDLYCDQWRPAALALETDELDGHNCAASS